MSKIVNKADFDTVSYKMLCAELKEDFRYHRKPWEFVMIAKTLFDNNMLMPGKSGIGFGVGTEPLPSYFLSKGCAITATDQPPTNTNTANWTGSDQYCNSIADINKRGICTEEDMERLTFTYMDMNYITRMNSNFDFVWSSCALEHLGTLQNGLWFITRSLSMLKPGGIAVHTTEYNLASNTDTNFQHVNCIYRKIDLDILEDTVNKLGCRMETVDYTRGTHEYDLYVDGKGWQPYKQEPHLNLRIDGFDATSVLLVIHKL